MMTLSSDPVLKSKLLQIDRVYFTKDNFSYGKFLLSKNIQQLAELRGRGHK